MNFSMFSAAVFFQSEAEHDVEESSRNSDLTSTEKSGRDRSENAASSSQVWHRDDNPFERSGREMHQRSSTRKPRREVQNQLTVVKLNQHNLEISNIRHIEKVFANVAEDDEIVLDQKVNVMICGLFVSMNAAILLHD